MAFENYGDPANYKRSGVWDTEWGKKAYDTNPYDKYTAAQGKWKNAYLGGNNPLSRFGAGVGADMKNLGSQYGGMARWGARSAAPNDPILGGYMSNIQGQQRNDINDMTRGVAGASVAASRGGMGVAGGTPVDSLLRNSGMESVARGASDRYDKAMGYAKDLYGGIADTYGQGLNAQLGAYSKAADVGLGLGAQELQGVQGGANYQQGMFGMRRDDFNSDQAAQQAWQAGTGARVGQRQAQDQQYYAGQQARDQQATLQNMMRKTYLGAPNTGYSPYEDELAQAEYLKQKGLIKGGGGRGSGSYNPSSGRGSQDMDNARLEQLMYGRAM